MRAILGLHTVRSILPMAAILESVSQPLLPKTAFYTKIPFHATVISRTVLSTVLKAEEQWAIPNHSQNPASTPPRYPRRGGVPELTHFPELTREHDGECREDDQR